MRSYNVGKLSNRSACLLVCLCWRCAALTSDECGKFSKWVLPANDTLPFDSFNDVIFMHLQNNHYANVRIQMTLQMEKASMKRSTLTLMVSLL